MRAPLVHDKAPMAFQRQMSIRFRRPCTFNQKTHIQNDIVRFGKQSAPWYAGTLKQRYRLRWLRGLGKHEHRQYQASADFFVCPVGHLSVDCHLLPEQLGEQMAICTSLHSVRNPLSSPRTMQVTLTVTISVLIKGCSAFVFIRAGLADFSRPASVHGWLQVAVIETDVSETEIYASSTCNFNIISLDG